MTPAQQLANSARLKLAQKAIAASTKSAFQAFPEDMPGAGPAVEPPKKEAGAQPPPAGGPPPPQGPQGAPPPPAGGPPPPGPEGAPPQGDPNAQQGPDPMQMLQEALSRTDQLLQMLQELGQAHSALQNEVNSVKAAMQQMTQQQQAIISAVQGPSPVTGATGAPQGMPQGLTQ